MKTTFVQSLATIALFSKVSLGKYSPQNDIQKAEQDPICSCMANCNGRGDPHVMSFYDHDDKVLTENFDMYRVGNFAIVAHADASARIGTIDIGKKTYKIDECNPGDVLTDFNDLGKNGQVQVNLNCTKNKDLPGNHFNVDIFKINDGNEFDFKTMEAKTNSQGQCVDQPTNSSRRLRSLSANDGSMKVKYPTVCYCSSYCAVYGDPEYVDLAGVKRKATVPSSGKMTIYKEENFEIVANIEGAKERIYSLDFGGKKYVAADICHTKGQQFQLNHTFKNGDFLEMTVTCFNLGGTHPFFFNNLLKKSDVPEKSDETRTFPAMEAARGSSGLCVPSYS